MKKLTFILIALFTCSLSYGQIRVITNGNTGIGTTTPTEQLEVAGNTKITGNTITLGPASGFTFLRTNTGSSRFNHAGTGQYKFTALDASTISFGTNNIGRVAIAKNSGNLIVLTGNALKPGGGMWAVYSDKRLKKNISQYSDGLEELLKINPVSFQYTNEIPLSDANKSYIGVIAQEVKEVAPYMVEQTELYGTDGEVKSNDYLSVDPNAFTYMLINSVKDQQKLIEEQTKLIETLTTRLDRIESQISNGPSNSSSSVQTIELGNNDAFLLQNQPNPFSETTTIKYMLPKQVQSANLVISDISGKQIKRVVLDKTNRNGQVELTTSEFNSGTYTYSLIIDGNLFETKKMVFQK